MAKSLTVGLLSPIYAQIDPIRLAEVDRSMRIAKEYAERLSPNKNLKEGTLEKLLVGYPSHGFVIDRGEAKRIFRNVQNPTGELRELGNIFRPLADEYIAKDEPLVAFFSTERPLLEQDDPPVPAEPPKEAKRAKRKRHG